MIPILQLNRTHREAILAHLLSLVPEARRLRFGMSLHDEGIIRYVDKINFDVDGLFGIFNDALILVAFTHAARAGDMVEFGVSVAPDYRKRGYGTALFEKAELFARNHYIHKLYLHCLRENEPMMKMARKAGMSIVFDAGEVDSYLVLPKADTASITKDLAQEEYATFDLALKQGVHQLSAASDGLQSLFSAYMNVFVPRTTEPAPKPAPESKVKEESVSTDNKTSTQETLGV